MAPSHQGHLKTTDESNPAPQTKGFGMLEKRGNPPPLQGNAGVPTQQRLVKKKYFIIGVRKCKRVSGGCFWRALKQAEDSRLFFKSPLLPSSIFQCLSKLGLLLTRVKLHNTEKKNFK